MQQRVLCLIAVVLVCVCQNAIAQNAPAKTRAVKPPVAKSKAAPAYTAEGNKFTIKLDEHGTSLAFEFFDQGFLKPPAEDYRMVSVFTSFKTAEGCNSWFGKSAIFILDEISTITVPGPAQCPLPPPNRLLAIWLLEQISQAQIVKMQLDGGVYDISPQQLSALKEFVDKRLPTSDWRKAHAPYELGPASQYMAHGAMSAYTASHAHFSALPSDRQSGTFRSDRRGVRLDFIIDATQNNFHEEDTYDFAWSDLQLSLFDVRCESCVKQTKESRVTGDKGAPEVSMTSPTFLWGFDTASQEGRDNARALAFLWYQNIYLNQRY